MHTNKHNQLIIENTHSYEANAHYEKMNGTDGIVKISPRSMNFNVDIHLRFGKFNCRFFVRCQIVARIHRSQIRLGDR